MSDRARPGRWLLLAGGLMAAAFARPPSCAGGAVTVSGRVRGLGTVQMEPQETPQSSFFLESTDFSCAKAPILVMAPGYLLCSDGDHAFVVGDYLPPGGVSTVPMIDGARVTCFAK